MDIVMSADGHTLVQGLSHIFWRTEITSLLNCVPVRGTGKMQDSARASSGKANMQANANQIRGYEIPPGGVESYIPWNPMPENANFYQLSLREGFPFKFKSMQIGIIRKTVFIHRCFPYLTSIAFSL